MRVFDADTASGGMPHFRGSVSVSELELFIETLIFTDPAERAAFLDEVCAKNPDPADAWNSCWTVTPRAAARWIGCLSHPKVSLRIRHS